MKISTAYDAFWFLTEHPNLKFREAMLLTPEEVKTVKLDKGERLRTVKDQMSWVKTKYTLREFALKTDSLSINLSIFWAKVDARGRVNDDPKKNVHRECWLEFGRVEYVVSDGRCDRLHYHDPDLDCGAPTFDAALVKLARLVRKHYGDYKAPAWMMK